MPKIDPVLFAHIQNDAFLGGTSGLTGSTFGIIVNYFAEYLEKTHAGHKLNVETESKITHLRDSMLGLTAIEAKMGALNETTSTSEEITELAKDVTGSILSLSEGQDLLIPGGWNNHVKGANHAMVYQIKKVKDGFEFCIYNAGAGIQYHDKISGPRKDYFCPVKAYRMSDPVDATELTSFIYRLLLPRLPLHPQRVQNAWFDAKKLYTETLPSIAHLDADEIAGESVLPQHTWTAGQISGTCTQRSLNQMLKNAFVTQPEYQRFIFEYKLYALDEYCEATHQNNTRSFEEREQILLAIENNLKLLNLPGVFSTQYIDEKFQYLAALKKQVLETPLATAPLPSDAPLVPSPLIRLNGFLTVQEKRRALEDTHKMVTTN